MLEIVKYNFKNNKRILLQNVLVLIIDYAVENSPTGQIKKKSFFL